MKSICTEAVTISDVRVFSLRTDLQVGDGSDGGKWILFQQALLVQELPSSAIECRLEETVVQNI